MTTLAVLGMRGVYHGQTEESTIGDCPLFPNLSYVSPYMRTSRDLALPLLCLLLLALAGCTTIARGPGNRSLLHTRLPTKSDFKGVVFVLENPPKAEFAFLLAQQYPNSFIAVMPSEKDPKEYDPFYLSSESKPPRTIPASLIKSDTITRKDSFMEPRRDVTVRPQALPSILIIHHMLMTGCDQLPETITSESCIRLSWSTTTAGQAEDTSLQKTNSALERFPLNVLSGLSVITIGLLCPPIPLSNMEQGRYKNMIQILNATVAPERQVSIPARKKSKRGIFLGYAWYLLVSPFVKDDPVHPYFESYPSYRSPGGWADCLEQMFEHSELLHAASNVTSERLAQREAWFKKQFEIKGFVLETIPYLSPYIFHEDGRIEIYLVPRNPVVNLYLYAFFPVLKFGRVKWPGVCVLKDASDPDGPAYHWTGVDKEGNHLLPVLHRGDREK
jgi:hypothetical protein